MNELGIFTILLRDPGPYDWDLLETMGRAVGNIEKKYTASDGSLQRIAFTYAPREIPEKETNFHFFARTGNQTLETMLPVFEEKFKDKFAGVSIPILGYVLIVTVKYTIVSSHKVVFSSGPSAETHEEKIVPESSGWFGVKRAVNEYSIFRQLKPDAPYVIAVVNHDTPNAMPFGKLREELGIGDEIRLIPCDPTNKDDAKRVFTELLEVVGTPEAERAKEMIEAL